MSALRKLIPLGDRVLVKRVAQMTRTASGIHLPDSAIKTEKEAEVVAVGPGRMLDNGNMSPMNVAIGDKVLLQEYGGTLVELEDEEFHLIRDGDILGKFE